MHIKSLWPVAFDTASRAMANNGRTTIKKAECELGV
jgi:hypothetical protein